MADVMRPDPDDRGDDQRDGEWDDEVDFLVLGAGVAGMTAALVASLEGMATLLCEKTAQVGGTTSTSGGTAWVPGTTQSVRAGVPDSSAEAGRFLDSVVGARGGAEQRAAFLESGPLAIDDLEARTDVRFVAALAHPDYLGNHPGAAHGGRALGPEPFDGRLLGADFDRVRPPRPEFLVLGGMMVARTDIDPLLKPMRSRANLSQATRLLVRHARDRLRYRRGTRLVMGNALVARLFHSLRKRQVPILFETGLADLVRNGDRVVGAVLDGPGGRRRVRARKGVMLATGGVTWNEALRARLFPEAARAISLAPPTNTGDGIATAMRAGAALDDGHDSPGLWMPCSIWNKADGTVSIWPHILLDRAKPGLIAVNGAGRRFVNESDSYHDFCMGMLRSHETTPSIPAHLICDRGFIRDFGMGMVHQGTRRLKPFIDDGYLIEAATLGGLAERIGVDPATLERTVAEHNGYARTGVDEAFGKGSSPMNRFNGDPGNAPNPCLRPIGPGPYYAMAVQPADLAGSAGLCGDADGRVLDDDGRPIEGLYVGGNDMTSIFRGTYPGPGTTIGPAIVFAWRTARHAAGAAAHTPNERSIGHHAAL